MGETKRGKGTKLLALVDRSGLPLSVSTASASPHEVTLVREAIAASFLDERPERLIGDRAYDSDPLDAALRERGIDMFAPHRRNRKKPKTQDGRKLTAEFMSIDPGARSRSGKTTPPRLPKSPPPKPRQ